MTTKIKIFLYFYTTDKIKLFERKVNRFIKSHNIVNHSEVGYDYGMVMTLWYREE